jgi:hypothetical protein
MFPIPQNSLVRGLVGGLVGGVVGPVLGPGGITTVTALQHAVGCRIQLSLPGRRVPQLVVGYWSEPTRPHTLPDLLLLGRNDLLTATSRRRLIRARDQALAARRIDEERREAISSG